MNIKKENFLSGCLLESLEDENLSNSKGLLNKYHANPFKIIYGRGIAPIHYASGMENVIFAEEIIQLMLIMVNQEGKVDVQTDDGETPLHIASFWGRGNIVKMLLNHNANIDIIDNDNNTAINCALQEGHFHIIDIFKKWIFEKKFFKKLSSITPSKTSQNNNNNNSENIKLPSYNGISESTSAPPPQPPPPANKPLLLLHVNTLNEQKYTPNRKNFNYDITSPYYINVTHRRKNKNMKNKLEINGNDDEEANVETAVVAARDVNNNDDDHSNNNCILKTNLFELTEENLYEYSKSLNSNNTTDATTENNNNNTTTYGYNSTNRKKSLVNAWREKVNSYRIQQKSNIHSMEQLDEILSKYDVTDENNHLNIAGQLLPENGTIGNSDDCDLSFETAKSNPPVLNESNFIKSPNINEYILQATEEYIHTDDENGIMFLEKKTLPYNVINQSYLGKNRSQTTISTEYTIPIEYDTDTLRAELTQFGECPGPITKSTKRLYVKRIIKYKRKPELAKNKCTNSNNNQPIYPVELQKTLQSSSVDCWQTIILSYSDLECKLIDYFNSMQNAKKLKLREGHLKTSFIYLLIDPRVCENLPGESKLISKHDAWKKFISSIFYVGKGKSSRPYSHLYQAIQFYQQQMVDQQGNDHKNECKQDDNNLLNIVSSRIEKLSLVKTTRHNKFTVDNKKLQKIIDIWQSGKGVVCLHVYHNIIPVEAYTREAAIIDSLSLSNLTNLKRGDYYGITQSWNCRMRRQLGIFLLYKALQIFIQEGESQLKPKDIL